MLGISHYQGGIIVLQEYRLHVEQRAAQGIVPKPLDAQQGQLPTRMWIAPPTKMSLPTKATMAFMAV